MTDTIWKCEQLQAGRVYASSIFNSKEEAEAFAKHLERVVPDQFFRIEPILASQVWN